MAGPMYAGKLDIKKYVSVGHDERFGTPFAHVINLKVPKAKHRAKFRPLGPHRAGPMYAGQL